MSAQQGSGAAPSGTGSAAVLLRRRLEELLADLHRYDAAARTGEPDGVHQLRVVCRRLRAALATFRPLLDPSVSEPVRDELRWVARALGEARDAEVGLDRVRALVDDESPSEEWGPARRRLAGSYRDRAAAADAVVQETLASERYAGLLDGLHRLVSEPPWRPGADQGADKVLRTRLRRERARVQGRWDRVAGAADRDVARHDLRKAVKRLRYAAEAARPVWGEDASRLVAAAQRVTSVLGELQDTVLSRADLGAIAAEARAAGESDVVYRRLQQAEELRAEQLLTELDDAWGRLQEPERRRLV